MLIMSLIAYVSSRIQYMEYASPTANTLGCYDFQMELGGCLGLEFRQTPKGNVLHFLCLPDPNITFLIFIFIDLFGCMVLVRAHQILVLVCKSFSCSMWDLVS